MSFLRFRYTLSIIFSWTLITRSPSSEKIDIAGFDTVFKIVGRCRNLRAISLILKLEPKLSLFLHCWKRNPFRKISVCPSYLQTQSPHPTVYRLASQIIETKTNTFPFDHTCLQGNTQHTAQCLDPLTKHLRQRLHINSNFTFTYSKQLGWSPFYFVNSSADTCLVHLCSSESSLLHFRQNLSHFSILKIDLT